MSEEGDAWFRAEWAKALIEEGAKRVSLIRFTNVVHALRLDGDSDAADAVERARGQFPPCKTHGEIEDPLVLLNQHGDLFFGCPFCSGAAVLARWRAEVPEFRF